MSEDPLKAQFNKLVSNLKQQKKKETEEDEHRLGVVYFGDSSSSDRSYPSDPTLVVDTEKYPVGLKVQSNLPDGPTQVVEESQQPPVGKKNVPIVNFGFDSKERNKVNLEFDTELKEEFQSYSEDRSFTKDVISFCERYFFEHGELPSFSLLHETFNDYPERPRYVKQWKDILERPDSNGLSIIDKLDVRGLPTFRTAENYLAPEFVTACHLILNIRDNRSVAAKLKDVGISTAKWNAWLKRKPYHDYYKTHAERIFDQEVQVETKVQLSRLVQAGDLQAIKYVDERTGVYRANESTNQQVIAALLQGLMAILARTVSADILNTIAAEIREEPVIKQLMGEKQEVIDVQ